ncbi:MAG: GNAT family N-acetyltransferase [Chloroflexi bacterium]|nr:GNAT family N-acetyltransferase [Chloroflexota bacterium]
MNSRLIDYMPWDSAHFGVRIARATCRKVDTERCGVLLRQCREQRIDCLYFLADAAEQDTILVLQSNGFDFVDIRLTLAAHFEAPPAMSPAGILRFRLGNQRDLDQLLPVAGASFVQSRFYVDPRFGHDKATRMYQIWLQRSFAEESDGAVVVAEHDGAAVGFVTCHLQKPAGEGNIGLVGVAEAARGLGCAGGMLKYAARWFASQGMVRLNVVTQGRNIAAQRLYQRNGFVTRSVALWFHKWFD